MKFRFLLPTLGFLFCVAVPAAHGQAYSLTTGAGSSASEQTTGDANVTWTAGKTTVRQTAALTANRTGTLPAANGYASGTIIVYTDRLTTGAFGVAWSPAGSDTLNGAGASVTVFTAGGTARFETDGVSAWTQLDTHSYSPTYATNAQAVTGTSTTVALNPANIPFGVFGINRQPIVFTGSTNMLGASSSTGSGSVSFGGDSSFDATSGATASSYGERDSANNISGVSPSASALTGGLNFDKMVGFTTRFRLGAGTANGVCRLSFAQTLGANAVGTAGKLAGKGIGLEIRNAALYGTVHDGTTFTATSLATTLTANAYTTVQCFRSGTGTFDFYVNGAFAVTVSGGPTGSTTSHTTKAAVAADNGGDAANQEFIVFQAELFQGL